jgi:hypothetical protein
VQPDCDYHQVRGPPMHIAQQLAEGDVVLEIQDVAKCLHFAGVVIKHQHDTGEGQHNKKVECDPAHAPGVAVAHCVAVDLGRVQMQKHVGQHAQSPVTRRVVMLVAEDRGVNLGLGRIFEALDLLLGLNRHVRLE